MGTQNQRLSVDFPPDDYKYLKILCTKKRISIEDFVVPLILKALKEEEESLLAKKTQQRLNNINLSDLVPIEDAFKEAGWDIKDV